MEERQELGADVGAEERMPGLKGEEGTEKTETSNGHLKTPCNTRTCTWDFPASTKISL